MSNGKTLTLHGYRAVAADGQLATEICQTGEAAIRAAIAADMLAHAPGDPEATHTFVDSLDLVQCGLLWAPLKQRGWRVVPVFR